jgi:hypothetical protein
MTRKSNLFFDPGTSANCRKTGSGTGGLNTFIRRSGWQWRVKEIDEFLTGAFCRL